MRKLKNIHCDLSAYKITLTFEGGEGPLVVYFDTPSRRFYCSVIALVIIEMKRSGSGWYVYIRRHEETLKRLDKALSGKHASKNPEGMWAKIRMAWRNRLPDLESAALFKVRDRDLVSPYEKGAKYRYRCSEAECDAWANLFRFDENNKWRFRFDAESGALGLNDVSVTFGQLTDTAAWDEFIRHLSIDPEPVPPPIEPVSAAIEKPAGDAGDRSHRARFHRVAWACAAFFLTLMVAAVVGRLAFLKPEVPADPIDRGLAVYPPADKPSLAVLPFENLTGDPQQEFLSDGISDQLITSLSQGPYLYVTARTSSFAFKGQPLTAQQIAAKLGVRFLVEGSVQRDADRLRINVQLIDGQSGNHVMSETFDRQIEDLFQLQDDIAMRVMSFFNVTITGYAAGDLKHSRPKNSRAYEHYLRGLYYHLGRRPQDIPAARQAFEQAIRIDPQFGRAYTWLANVYLDEIDLRRTTRREQTLEKAEEIAQKGLAADPHYPPYGTLSRICRLKKDAECAIAYARKGVAQSPNDSGQYYMLNLALMQGEFFEEAIEAIETALRLAPFRPVNYLVHLAWSLVGNRQYEASVPLFEEIIERSPRSFFAYIAYKGLVVAFESSGRHVDAQEAAKKVLKMNPNFSIEREMSLSMARDGPFLRRAAQAYRDAGLR